MLRSLKDSSCICKRSGNNFFSYSKAIFSVPEQGARKPRCRKRTSPPPPCKTNFNLVPEIAGCPEQVEIEEPGMRDNSGYPLPGPDREVKIFSLILYF